MPTTAARVRVLIVDDHPVVLEGICEILGEDPSMVVVGTATTAAEALDLARTQSPDVIFLDIRLSHDSGYELISDLRQASPLAECVAIAGSADADSFRKAMSRGAHGYLLDDASRVDICAAVQRVAAGKSHIDPAVSGLLVQMSNGRPNPAESAPTTREIDVLRLAADGLTNAAIANRLDLTTETVKTHMSRAFLRLGARDRANAVAICLRRGLI